MYKKLSSNSKHTNSSFISRTPFIELDWRWRFLKINKKNSRSFRISLLYSQRKTSKKNNIFTYLSIPDSPLRKIQKILEQPFLQQCIILGFASFSWIFFIELAWRRGCLKSRFCLGDFRRFYFIFIRWK